MQTSINDKKLCNDRWLAALVDAMDEVEALRSDDVCRKSRVPDRLRAQLRGQTQRSATDNLQFA